MVRLILEFLPGVVCFTLAIVFLSVEISLDRVRKRHRRMEALLRDLASYPSWPDARQRLLRYSREAEKDGKGTP